MDISKKIKNMFSSGIFYCVWTVVLLTFPWSFNSWCFSPLVCGFVHGVLLFFYLFLFMVLFLKLIPPYFVILFVTLFFMLFSLPQWLFSWCCSLFLHVSNHVFISPLSCFCLWHYLHC